MTLRELDLLWKRIDDIEASVESLSKSFTKCFWASIVCTAAIGGPPLVEKILSVFP